MINFEEIFEDNEFEDLGEIFGNEFNPFQFASNYQMNFWSTAENGEEEAYEEA